MGITSSNSRNPPPEKLGDSSPPEKLGDPLMDPLIDWPEPAKDALGLLIRDLNAMFESKEGDTERREKEGDTERREKETEVRFCEFMKGGACKQAFTALEDCVEETGHITKCRERSSMLFKCMSSHPDYYQPLLSLIKTAQEQLTKDLEAWLATKQADPGPLRSTTS